MAEYRNVPLFEFLSDICSSDLATLLMGDLDNPIHPLLHHNSGKHIKLGDDGTQTLQQITSAAYQAMEPALRLVSLLITEPSMLGFFDHVANGAIFSDDDGTCLAKGLYEGMSLGLEYVIAVFAFMSNQTQIIFQAASGHPATAVTHYKLICETVKVPAASNFLAEIEKRITAGGIAASRRLCNGFCYINLLTDGWLEYFEPCMDREPQLYRLNALFNSASILLVHETAHAFFGFVHPNMADKDEPRYAKHDTVAEIGWAYQKCLFGDIYHPTHMKVSQGKMETAGPTCCGTSWACTNAGCGSHDLAGEKTCRVCNTAHANTVYMREAWIRTNRVHLLEGRELCWYEKVPAPNKGPSVWRQPPIFNILTAETAQSWFLKSTWQKLKEGGHASQIKKSGRTTMQWLEMEHGVDW